MSPPASLHPPPVSSPVRDVHILPPQLRAARALRSSPVSLSDHASALQPSPPISVSQPPFHGGIPRARLHYVTSAQHTQVGSHRQTDGGPNAIAPGQADNSSRISGRWRWLMESSCFGAAPVQIVRHVQASLCSYSEHPHKRCPSTCAADTLRRCFLPIRIGLRLSLPLPAPEAIRST
jgi:hypothetical protein